ncbi:MAG: hypothetical protein M1820_010466 [Bogoriella megaspora]|nr:MAG: hypothetical protein M1820_010466 [Bogoriella megaspora]
MAPQSLTDPTDKSIKILCARHLHRVLTIDATDSHGRLRVTFSTTSNFDNASLPTMLFIGPMFCSRWHAVDLDRLACEDGIRVICSDRPSMGGSSPVPIAQRIPVWLETVPALLKALGIEHVSLMTHSAGTLFTLNTLYHIRHMLDPQRPFAAFMVPWVHGSNSDVMLPYIAAKLPSKMIGSFDGLHRFIQLKINPTLGWSGGIINSVTDIVQNPPAESNMEPSDAAEKYGVDEDTAKSLSKLMQRYMLAEETSATNEELLLCLQKAGATTWGIAEDYEKCMRELATRERERIEDSPESQHAKLHIRAYFASSDIMIGKSKGPAYFEQCWRQEGMSDVVDFESTIVPDTNHDTVISDYKKTAVRAIFKELQKIYNDGTTS